MGWDFLSKLGPELIDVNAKNSLYTAFLTYKKINNTISVAYTIKISFNLFIFSTCRFIGTTHFYYVKTKNKKLVY